MASGLEGQVAIVTGAGAGIGLACADRLARAGTAVCIADIDAEAATSAAGMLENAGHRCISITADISDSDQVAALFQQTAERLGPVTIAVNNAGVGAPLTPLAESEESDFDRVMAINLKGVWLCMREALRHMQPQGKGCIINMASALSLTTYPHTGLYTASKHAVVGLTRNAGRALGRPELGWLGADSVADLALFRPPPGEPPEVASLVQHMGGHDAYAIIRDGALL